MSPSDEGLIVVSIILGGIFQIGLCMELIAKPKEQLDIEFTKIVDSENWTIVLNCGKPIILEDGTSLDNLESGLFQNTKIEGEKLLVFKLGNELEVSDALANYCRNNWTQVFEIFPFENFKNVDFFRSPKIKLGNFEFNFWYCGENFSCGIHNEHNFFELHTQIFGQGEMQKFHDKDEKTIFYREILAPGKTHKPFFTKEHKYSYHQYKSISKCIWLAIESNTKFH